MQDMSPALEQMVNKIIGDLGAAAGTALVIVGDRLGLYAALAEHGPATPSELAEKTGTHERYLREWLSAQAAAGYVKYNAETRRFEMTPEQALVLADENGPLYMAGGFYSAASLANDEKQLAEAFRTGVGIPWGDHHECLFCGTEKFFRPSYIANLVQEWIPSLDGTESRLQAGINVADIGCGHGCSTLIMARTYPNSRFTGFDFHPPSIEKAKRHAAEHGLSNVSFELATAQDFPATNGNGYDFVTIFDALHDMGDPLGAARHVREVLAPNGVWMIVEPAAGDSLEENLNPIGRIAYAFSTAACVPSALSQEGGYSLGAQAGPRALQDLLSEAGFSKSQVAAQSPLNLVLEAVK